MSRVGVRLEINYEIIRISSYMSQTKIILQIL